MAFYIPIILGTARQGRFSEAVAKNVLEFTKTLDIETELLDVKNFPLTFTEELTPEIANWKAKAERADGFIIVAPEYNHGYPGELKLFLDDVYKECHRKPLGIVGVSKGKLGGARMVEQLRLVAIEFQMVPTRAAVYVSYVQASVNGLGDLKDIEELNKKLSQLTDELLWYAKVLKKEREIWNKKIRKNNF